MILLDSGAALFASQSNGDIDSVIFTGFRVGSAVGEVIDSNITVPMGTLLYTGNTSQLFFTPISEDTVLITCIIPRLFAEIAPGNIVLYGNNNTALFAQIYTSTVLKHQQTESTVGSQLTYTFIIRMPDLLDRMSFDNLTAKIAEFKPVETDQDVIRWPHEEVNDQLIVDADGRLNDNPVAIFNIGHVYWGVPLADYSDDNAIIGVEP